MKLSIGFFLAALAVAVQGAILQKVTATAEKCDEDKCKIADNCRCSSVDGPLALEETPQVIILVISFILSQKILKKLATYN